MKMHKLLPISAFVFSIGQLFSMQDAPKQPSDKKDEKEIEMPQSSINVLKPWCDESYGILEMAVKQTQQIAQELREQHNKKITTLSRERDALLNHGIAANDPRVQDLQAEISSLNKVFEDTGEYGEKIQRMGSDLLIQAIITDMVNSRKKLDEKINADLAAAFHKSIEAWGKVELAKLTQDKNKK